MKKNLVSTIGLLLLLCLLATSGFAANGEPLTLESSSPENGAVDVAMELDEIELMFSKNVVNMKVSENNKTCIDFVDEDGNTIPFELIMADDQVDREKRDYLTIRPEGALSEGTTYVVKISKELTSKSGTALEDDLEISFTTLGGPVEDEPAGSTPNIAPVFIGIIGAVIIAGVLVSRRKKS